MQKISSLACFVFRKIKQIKASTQILLLILAIIVALIPASISMLLKNVIDFISDIPLGHSEWRNILIRMLMSLFFLVGLLPICNALTKFVLKTSGISLYRNNMIKNTQHMSELEFQYFDDPEIHNKYDISCMESNVNPLSIYSPLINIISVIITMISFAIILARLSILLSLLPILMSVVVFLMSRRKELLNFKSNYDEDIMNLNRRINYFSKIVTEPVFSKENIIYNISRYFVEKRKVYKQQYAQKKLEYINKATWISFLGATFRILSQYAIYLLLGIAVLEQDISIGEFTLYFSAFSSILFSLNSIIDNITYIIAQQRLDEKYREFIELPTEKNNSDLIIPKGTGNKHIIEFEAVSFRYPFSEKDIFTDLNLILTSDDIVALIGENGCGKSTLIKLMIGYYKPQSGRIMLDNVDLNAYTRKDLARIFGVMFQEVAHMGVTISEFITMGKKVNDSQSLHDSISRAGCTELVESCIAGVDTMMTFKFDKTNARDFSGGEWQRLALARLYYQNPDIYIMDEPTAALDIEAEYKFFLEMRRISAQHMMVMVSHRLSVIKLSTKVIFITREKVWVGSHDELTRKSQQYREYYEKQRDLYLER